MRAVDRAQLQAWRYLHASISHFEKPPVTEAFDALGKVVKGTPAAFTEKLGALSAAIDSATA